jgi:hypothetical protein
MLNIKYLAAVLQYICSTYSTVHVCMCVCMYGIFFQYFFTFSLEFIGGTLTAILLYGGHLCYPICFSYRRVLGKDSNLEPSLFRHANHLAPLHPSVVSYLW